MTGPLPHTAAGPLHILPPWLPWLAALLAAAALIWLYKKYLKRYIEMLLERLRSKAAAPAAPAAAQPGPADIGGIISDIRGRYRKNGAYRAGLFGLSGEMKIHLEKKTGLPVAEMTAGEIRSRFSTPEPGKFFSRMEDSLFGAEEPKKEEFLQLCDQAEQVVGGPVKKTG